jgi:nonsense-mediated mRNA decay protein 3
MPELTICRCGRTLIAGRWAYREIAGLLKPGFELSNYEAVLEQLAAKRKLIMLEGPDGKADSLKARHEQCPICSKSASGYFEGTLQLRNKNSGSYQKAVDILDQMVSGTKDAFISKVVELDDGADFMLSSNNLLRKIARVLRSEFGGEIKESKSLYGQHRQTAKLLYRGTILLKLPAFAPGDVVRVGKRLIFVCKISVRKVIGTDLVTGEQASFPYHEPREVFRNKVLTKVIAHKPVLRVLDPETFQPRQVESTWKISGDEAMVIEVDGRLFLVPE